MKGITRRVVVIKSPDQRIFEEAIFIIRDDAIKNGGICAEDVVEQACRVAAMYVRRNADGRRRALWIPAACVAAGILLCGLAWLLFAL